MRFIANTESKLVLYIVLIQTSGVIVSIVRSWYVCHVIVYQKQTTCLAYEYNFPCFAHLYLNGVSVIPNPFFM